MAKVAVAWLDQRDWKRWQELDNKLPDYPRWLSKVESAIRGVEGTGASVEKIEVAPDRFIAWCKANKRPIDRAPRSQYAAEILMKRRAVQ